MPATTKKNNIKYYIIFIEDMFNEQFSNPVNGYLNKCGFEEPFCKWDTLIGVGKPFRKE